MQKIDYRIVIGLLFTSLIATLYTFLNFGDNYIVVGVTSLFTVVIAVISVTKMRELFHYAKEDIDFLDEGSISRFYKYQEIQIKLLKEVLDTFNKKFDGLTQENIKIFQDINRVNNEVGEKFVVQNSNQIKYLEELDNSLKALLDIYQNNNRKNNDARIVFEDKLALDIREMNSVITFAQNALVEEMKRSQEITEGISTTITEKIDLVMADMSKASEESNLEAIKATNELKEQLVQIVQEQEKIIENMNEKLIESGMQTKETFESTLRVIEGLDKKLDENKDEISLIGDQIDESNNKIMEEIESLASEEDDDEKIIEEIKNVMENNQNKIVEEIGTIHNRFTETEDKFSEGLTNVEGSINEKLNLCQDNLFEIVDTAGEEIKNEIFQVKEMSESTSEKTVDAIKGEIEQIKEANGALVENQESLITVIKEEIAEGNNTVIAGIEEVNTKLDSNNEIISSELENVLENVVEAKGIISEIKDISNESTNAINELKDGIAESNTNVVEVRESIVENSNNVVEIKDAITENNININEIKETLAENNYSINEVKEATIEGNQAINEVRETTIESNQVVSEVRETIIKNTEVINEAINEVKEVALENNQAVNEVKEATLENNSSAIEIKELIATKNESATEALEALKEHMQSILDKGINNIEDKMISGIDDTTESISYEDLSQELNKIVDIINSNNDNLNMEIGKIVENQEEAVEEIKQELKNANETIGFVTNSVNNSSVFKDLMSNLESWKEDEKEDLYKGLTTIQNAIENKLLSILDEIKDLNNQEQEVIVSTLKSMITHMDVNSEEEDQGQDDFLGLYKGIEEAPEIMEEVATTNDQSQSNNEEVRSLTKVVETEKKVVSELGNLDSMIRNIKNAKQEGDIHKEKKLSKALSATRKMAPIVVVEEEGIVKEFAGDKIIRINNKAQNTITEFIYDVNGTENLIENITKVNGEVTLKMEFNPHTGALKRGLEYSKEKITKEYLYYPSGQLNKRIEYKYTLGVLIRTIATVYDEEGNVIAESN